jgi:hypothetical protein
MFLVRSKYFVIVGVLGLSDCHSALSQNAGGILAEGSSDVGAPIWPPPPPVMESLAERHDPFFASRPSMALFPTWIFPLGVASTPGSLTPESRSLISGTAGSGKGTTRSPALFAPLDTVSEEGTLTIQHGQASSQGLVFWSAALEVQRTSLKKRGKSATFSTVVTEMSDVPSGLITVAARPRPGLWIGAGYQSRRYLSKTINEVIVSAKKGYNETKEQRDANQKFLAIEYQGRWAHAAAEVSIDGDDRRPAITYSVPMRFALGDQFWLGVGLGRSEADDRLNSETVKTTDYEVSAGRQGRHWAFELGGGRQAGVFRSSSGTGNTRSSRLFAQVGWGSMLGWRLLVRLDSKSYDSKNSNFIEDKGQVTSGNVGLAYVR